MIDLCAQVFIFCGSVCLERVGKARFPRRATNRQWRRSLCAAAQAPFLPMSQRKQFSCSHFPSTRLHPLRYHLIRLLPFLCIRDCKTSHLSHVAHSSDLHAGNFRACCCRSRFPLLFTPPLSCSPLFSLNEILMLSPEPQHHGTRAEPSVQGS